MKKQTMAANTIDSIETAKIKCDEACKKLFGITEIASYIMNYVCDEYKGLSREQVMDCLKEKPLISKVNVNDYEGTSYDSEEVMKLNGEDTSIDNGTVDFDVLIRALKPNTTEDIHIYVNYEGQMDYRQPRLYKRGQYYTARELSIQYGKEFSNGKYENLKKVYSIWICFNPAAQDRNTISSYSLTKKDVFGNATDYTEHNLTELVYICLGGDKSVGDKTNEINNEVLGMLNTLFSKKYSKSDKKSILQEKYNLTMTREIEEEAYNMCNYSDYIEMVGMERGMKKGMEKGMEEGMEKGMEKGKQETLERMRKIMKRQGRTEEEIMEIEAAIRLMDKAA